ncbi:hypothetical protein H4R99_006957, partial [Coemansia sp. RSA 1722]
NISGVHMASIPADAASYYATYNLGGPERRDNAGNMIPGAAGNQQLSAHGFLHHQTAQQQQQQHQHQHQHPHQNQHQHQQSPLLHTTVSQYHPQQHHPSQPTHPSMAQYHAQGQQQQQHHHHPQQQHPHLGSMPASSHHAAIAAVGADPASAYQTNGFSPYAHPAYHPQHPAAGFDPTGAAPVDAASATALTSGAGGVEHDYSVIAVTGALHQSTTPVHISQQQQQPHPQQPQQPQQQQQQQTQQQQHIHPHAITNNGMRFDCILEAPTAAAQKADESTLTYLNKGQMYAISMLDKTHSDAFYNTTLRIAFHEDSHRKSSATYWNFWLNQQENPRSARAIEIDKAGSIGVIAAENKQFNQVAFQWQGRRGAKVMIRFNCLSTDFSRIKGVKGIPLRIHLDTYHAMPSAAGDMTDFAASISQMSSPIVSLAHSNAAAAAAAAAAAVAMRDSVAQSAGNAMSTPVSPVASSMHNPQDTQHSSGSGAADAFSPVTASTLVGNSGNSNSNDSGNSTGLVYGKLVERCYARVKLFRDKGAERKNKDDQRHLDKLWEKQKAKLALNNSNNSNNGSNNANAMAQQIQQQLAEFTMTFAPVQTVTTFVEYTVSSDEYNADESVALDDLWATGGASVAVSASASATAVAAAAAVALESPESAITTPITGLSSMNLGMPTMHLNGLNAPLTSAAAAMAYMRKRSADDLDLMSPNKRQFSPASLPAGINEAELVGIDPTYVPISRKKKSVLAMYVKFQGEHIYRAIYLERLAVDDLVSKLAQRLEIQATSDIEVIRKTKKGLTVKVDDNVISQLDDQQDMEVECSFADDTGNLTIYLHY